MMFNTMAQARMDRLHSQAVEAVQQYNKDLAAGGEPVFPDWVTDLAALLDANKKMVRALKQWDQFAKNNAWDDENCTFLPDTRAALTAAGAV